MPTWLQPVASVRVGGAREGRPEGSSGSVVLYVGCRGVLYFDGVVLDILEVVHTAGGHGTGRVGSNVTMARVYCVALWTNGNVEWDGVVGCKAT